MRAGATQTSLAAIVLAVTLLAAAIAAGEETMSTAPSLDDLAWLQGTWSGEALGGVAEEVWLHPAGDVLHVVFRLVTDGKTKFSEYVQVTQEAGMVIMRFAHFRPDYTTWEGEGPVMEMRLVESADGLARFEAANEVSPDRIEYRRGPDGALHVHVTGLSEPLVLHRHP